MSKKGKYLAGCHIAITGTLSKVRAQIVSDIQSAGGTFSATVTGNTTHLVAANPFMDTVKFQKAREKGVVVCGEDFLATGKVGKVFGEEDAVAAEEDEAKRVTFEYFDHAWKPYAEEAHGIVEAAFQDWLGDRDVDSRPVKSGEFIYAVNFDDWTQKNMQVPPHTVRQIRRLVGGEPQANVESPRKKKADKAKEEEPEEEEKPKKRGATKKKAAAKRKTEDDEEEEEEEEKPKKRATKKKTAAKRKAGKEDEEEEEEEEAPKKRPAKKAAKEAPEKKKASAGGGVFDGLVFCITGKLSQPRQHFEKLISEHGGKVAKSMTAAVTHCISSEGFSSAKLAKRPDHVLLLTEEFLTDAVEDGELPKVTTAYEIDA